MNLPDWLIALAAVIVLIVGSARLTRVLVHDDFPPSVWVRMQWDRITNDGPWSKLVHCWWCASAWITWIALGWGVAGYFVPWIAWTWWVFWGGLAASYLATMVIVRDEPSDSE